MWVPWARDVTDHQKKCVIKLKPGQGRQEKKKKISQIFGFHNKEEGYCCFQRRWGRSLERKIHF